MCPCVSSKSEYATCNHHESIAMCPSSFEKENYCFSLYELCPVFCPSTVQDAIKAEIMDRGYESPAYV